MSQGPVGAQPAAQVQSGPWQPPQFAGNALWQSAGAAPSSLRSLQGRAQSLIAIEFVMLALSMITGGFQFTVTSMSDSAALLAAIAITTLVFTSRSDDDSEAWLQWGTKAFLIGVALMMLNLMVGTEEWNF